MNFVSQLEWKATGFVLPSVLQRSSASPVNHPGCAWKRLRWSAGVGDISSEFITVQSLYKGSHSTLAFVFPPMKIVHTMTNLIHCRCLHGIFQMRPQWTNFSLRGKGEDTRTVKKKKEKPKLKFALILCGIFHPGQSSLGRELMETLFWQLKEYLWIDEPPPCGF